MKSIKRILLVVLCLLSSQSVMAFDIYLVRHFEKEKNKSDPSLTASGVARANVLAARFADIDISQVFSTNYKRTLETAFPLAQAKSLETVLYNPSNLDSLAHKLLANKQTVVVVGHSNTTPALIQLLGGPKFAIAESEYGRLYHMSFSSDAEPEFNYSDVQ